MILCVLDDRHICWELAYDVHRELGYPITGGDYDCPTLTELNMACRGLLNMTSKEQVKYHVWRKSHPRLGVDKK